jgi:hypothetical protein
MNLSLGNPGEILSRKRLFTLFGDKRDLLVTLIRWERPTLEVSKDFESLNFTFLHWELEFLPLPILPHRRRERAQSTVWRFLAAGTPYAEALKKADAAVQWPNGLNILERAYRVIRFRWGYRLRLPRI